MASNQKLYIRKKSKIHSSGLFAKTDITEGARIIEYRGLKVTKTNLQNDLINLELREILLMTIKKLPDQQQLAILLHYFSGYSQKEVSTLLNKSEKATESLIIRARKKLKNLLPLNLREELSNA